jgi:4'-phosphopantetheinyl transferase
VVAATGTGEVGDASGGPSGVVLELCSEEIARSERISSEEERRRYLESHVWLRRLLAARLGVAPVAISFRRGVAGKPELAQGGSERVRVNMSRSGELALYAISAGREVGIDVQECVAGADLGRRRHRFLSAAEKEVLAGLDDHERRRAFYRTWVRKEAFLKAAGVGLAVAWSAVDTSRDLVRVERELSGLSMRPGGVGQWSVHDLSIGSGGTTGGLDGTGTSDGLDGTGTSGVTSNGRGYVAALSVEGVTAPRSLSRASRSSLAVLTTKATAPPLDRG